MAPSAVTYWFRIAVNINGTLYGVYKPATCLVPIGATVWLDDGDETQWSFPEPFRVESVEFWESLNSFDIHLGLVDIGDCEDSDEYQLEGLRAVGWVRKPERHAKNSQTTE